MNLKNLKNLYNFINTLKKNKINFYIENNLFHNNHSGTFHKKYVEVQNIKILVKVQPRVL